MLLLLLSACAPDPSTERTSPSDTASESGDTACPDADADGWCADAGDCDDADPAVSPAAPEVCDGLDQDCDGAADDGLVTDGEGCADEAPDRDDTFDTLEVTLRTGDAEHDGTTERVELCVNDEDCAWLDTADWDDALTGQTDVYHLDVGGFPRAAIDRITLRTEAGENAWVPTCVSLSGDGEPLATRLLDGVEIGTASGETPTWEGTLGIDAPGCFDAPLTHGPMLGAVDGTSAILWFRTDASRAVEVRVADDEDDVAATAPVHVSWPDAARDFTATVRLLGLEPAHTYHYTLTIEGETYGPWSIATPAEEPTPLRVAFGSCARDAEQPIFATILDEAPDLFLFVGDNHYGNTSDRDGQRAWYRQAFAHAERAELLAGTSILATWDDHDYAGNDTDGDAEGKEEALAVFSAWWANPSYGLDELPGTFFRWRHGEVEVFAVDGRYYKDLEDSTLGTAQLAWLVEALGESTATFKLVVSGTQVTADYSDDAWSAHEADRDAFLEAIGNVDGVLFLSGDVHRSELRLDTGPRGAVPELTSSPLANGNSPCRDDAEVLSCWDEGNSFVVLDLDPTPEDPSIEARIVLEDGTVAASRTFRLSEW